LLLRERTARVGPGDEPAGIRFLFADQGELEDGTPVADAAAELIQQFVHPGVTLRRQRRDRLREVLGVVITHGSPYFRNLQAACCMRVEDSLEKLSFSVLRLARTRSAVVNTRAIGCSSRRFRGSACLAAAVGRGCRV